MADNLGKLTTPDAFINYYYQIAQKYFKTKGIQVNKVGYFGFLLNLLGWTQYDAKNYYHKLYQDAFLATATSESALLLHAAVYGYITQINASYATATGTFQLNTSALPPIDTPSGYEFRERTLSFMSEPVTVSFNGIQFTVTSKYTFKQTSSGAWYCIVERPAGIKTVPLTADFTVDLFDTYQYRIEEVNIRLPKYLYGTFYTYTLNIPEEEYLADLEVWVKEYGASDYERFEVRYTKFMAAADKVVFLTRTGINTYQLEFGSGYRGKHIPSADIKIRLKLTQGSKGNIVNQTSNSFVNNNYIQVIDTFQHTSLATVTSKEYTVAAGDILTMNIVQATGGEDPPKGSALRDAIMAYIQTRDNLISENDYNLVMRNYFPDVKTFFVKADLFTNTVYVLGVLRDAYQNVVKATSMTIEESTFNSSGAEWILYPTISTDSSTLVSPFLYHYDSTLGRYEAYIFHDTLSTYFDYIREFSDQVAVPLSLELEYDSDADTTTFRIKSTTDISAYTWELSVPALAINNVAMSSESTTSFTYTYNGKILDEIDVVVRGSEASVLWEYHANGVRQAYNISDILWLPRYYDGSNYWVVYVPFVDKDFWDNNKAFVLDFLKRSYVDSNITDNRMITDDIQVRFQNTFMIPSAVLQALTVQNYSFDLYLPLKLTVDIYIDSDYIHTYGVDFAADIENLKVAIAQYLVDNYTGSEISVYYTQLIDFIHDQYPWIKKCEVQITDSSGNACNEIETTSDEEVLKNLSSKLDRLKYTPVYWWWDANNITINTYLA